MIVARIRVETQSQQFGKTLMRISSSFTSVAVLSATAVALLSACSPNPTNATANTRAASVSKGTLLATVSATGNIQPEDEVKLTFQSLGTVALLKANVGDSVQKGTVIAALDTADLDMALKKARSALKDSESALVIARSNYSRTIEGARPAEIAAAAASLSAANANYNKVNAGPEAADQAALDAKLRNAEAALRRAQSVYDAAYREDPAGIGGHSAGLELEQATKPTHANGLRPGMTANTRVVLEERPGVLLAPNWAIRKDKKASKSYLTVPAADNKTTDLEVVTGLKDDTFTEIISGAAEGQAIVAPEGSQP